METKTYNHTKKDLAIAVGRNASRTSNFPVTVYYTSVKSIQSMKFVDTTVVQVIQYPASPLHSALPIAMFKKGKQVKISSYNPSYL